MTVITMVAVVLPRRLNHNSLYLAGITWKMACGMLAKNLRIIHVRYYFMWPDGRKEIVGRT